MSCISLLVTAVATVFLGGNLQNVDCDNVSCLSQSPSPSVFLTPFSSASASAFSSASTSAFLSASTFLSASPVVTTTATATFSYDLVYRPDAFEPEHVCDDRSAYVRYLPCTNTVALSENAYEYYRIESDRKIESDTWQIPGDSNEYKHISYIGIPMQVIFSSLHIRTTLRCTTIADFHSESNAWTKHSTHPVTVEYSELSTYENVWFKLTRPAAVHASDVCQVRIHVSGRAGLYLQMDHLENSFMFGLIA